MLLLVIGLTNPTLITKHRRTKQFSITDYDLLVNLLAQFKTILVTPNTLTEASNLLRQHAEPERSEILSTFRTLIKEKSKETVIASANAVDHVKFLRLGLTDVALLSQASLTTPLITVDLDLYLEALRQDADSAFNFNHIRDLDVIP